MTGSERLRRTPLFDNHVSSGARIVPFAGWEMPLHYQGILHEARAVRSRAGLFDVSHMGRLEVRGPAAHVFLDRVLSVDVSGLRLGRARYTLLCNEAGGILDDCIVFRLGDERFMLIPNSSNMRAVAAWLARWAPSGCAVTIADATGESGMIALQGPDAAGMLAGLCPVDLASMRSFAVVETRVAGVEALVSRTGYTGEDGFELIVPAGSTADVWQALADAGAEPCGLGARDVLRLEAGLLLHGSDMDASTDPFEAGLARFVDADRPEYVAGEALRRLRLDQPGRRLVGIRVTGRGIPRQDHPLHAGGRGGGPAIGHVTSGGYSPVLDTGIGLGYVPRGHDEPETPLTVNIRGRMVGARVTSLPFLTHGARV